MENDSGLHFIVAIINSVNLTKIGGNYRMMNKNEENLLKSFFSEASNIDDLDKTQLSQIAFKGASKSSLIRFEQYKKDVLNEFEKYVGIPKIANHIGLSCSHRKKLLRVILKNTMLLLILKQEVSSVDSFGRLLTFKNPCAEKLYDVWMYLDYCTEKLSKSENLNDFQHYLNTMITMLDRFTLGFTEIEYNNVVKKFLCSLGVTMERLFAEQFLYFVHPLMIEWFSRGVQAAGTSTIHFSILSSIDLSICELDVLLRMSCPIYNDVIIKYFSDKERKTVESAFIVLNGEKALIQFKNILAKDNYSIILDEFEREVIPSALSRVFSNDVVPNLAIHCFNFKSVGDLEDKAKLTSLFWGESDDILKKRRIFVREKGVKVCLTKPVDDIHDIYIKEIHESDEHFILVRYLRDNGRYREFYLDIKNINVIHLQAITRQDYSVLLWILCWLGLQEEIEQNLRNLNQTDLPISEQIVKDIYDYKCLLAKDSNLVYEDPIAWNYEYKSHSACHKNQEQPVNRKQVTVGRYIRRLPNGTKASVEAKACAEQFCLELEDGYTFVNEFTRMQKAKVKNSDF